jgi:hypothetical protein
MHAVGVQRLGVLVAVMLARERWAPTAAADGRAPLAAALGALPSGVLAMVAEAVAALGYADVPAAPSWCARPAVPNGAPRERKRTRTFKQAGKSPAGCRRRGRGL